MKVTITLSVEVDRDAWELTYGAHDAVATLRTDVKEYVLNHVQGSAAAEEGAITRVTLKS